MKRKSSLSVFFVLLLLLTALCMSAGAEGNLEKGVIVYQGEEITLSEKELYVDPTATATSPYVFNTLQDCVAAAQSGTRGDETVIYMAPGVYWTDDYTDETIREGDALIGLSIPQPYITLIGLTGNRDDVVIASDRGQNAGANGNFNTIGVADGFHAKDITFGNYCNVDLVYERDPSQNHPMRQGAIVQAQVITKAAGADAMDEWFFENCSFVSRLNLFSRDDRPDRTLYKDCHFECTDDSIGTGYISLYVNCDFDLYSNTPSGSASNYLQAYLGCTFNTHLTDPGVINLSKHVRYFALMDCAFNGNLTGVEWRASGLYDNMRNIVANSTLNGEKLVVSASHPEYTIEPDETLLAAFKTDDGYNVYNLLNNAGFDEWDPLGQKDTVATAPWEIRFLVDGNEPDEYDAPVIIADGETAYTFTPVIFGGSESPEWTIDSEVVTLDPQEDGSVKLIALDYSYEGKTAFLTAKTSNGLEKVLPLAITSPVLPAPALVGDPALTVENGKAVVSYSLTPVEVTVNGEKNDIDASLNPDQSVISWYRNDVIVATTTYVNDGAMPYAAYELTAEDAGAVIKAVIEPQYKHSQKGEGVAVALAAPIAAEDVKADANTRNIDLSTLAYTVVENASAEEDFAWDTAGFRSGYWYGGFYLPAEYRAGGVFESKRFSLVEGELPFTYAPGTNGASGTVGLQTTTQGARLVYCDDTARNDMSMTVTLSPHKNAGQGFGSGNQFLEIYFKYDACTMSGYGLRITREAATDNEQYKDYLGKSCSFQLMEYENGIATLVSEQVFATAFNPMSTVVLTMEGNTLTATVSTTMAQGDGYPEYMANDVTLTHTFEQVNTYGGIGFQHTGTAGAGKAGNRTTIHSIEIEYK